jgi:hypothetical protein
MCAEQSISIFEALDKTAGELVVKDQDKDKEKEANSTASQGHGKFVLKVCLKGTKSAIRRRRYLKRIGHED